MEDTKECKMSSVYERRIGDKKFNFKFMKATESQVAEIAEHLLKHFLVHEPLCRALDLKADACRPWFERVARDCVNADISYVAILVGGPNEGAIIAVCLCDFVYRNCQEETEKLPITGIPTAILEGIHPLVNQIERLVWNVAPDDITRLYDINIVSTDTRYGRRGVGRALVNWTVDQLAERKICPGVMSVATACASRSIFRQLLFEEIMVMRYTDYTYEDTRIFADVPEPETHASLELLIFDRPSLLLR